MTSQGHPRTVFHRALDCGNLFLAETTAREVGSLDLREALDLTALTALHNRERGGRLAVRWLQRWLDGAAPTIDEAAMVASSLAALGGVAHHEALLSLRALADARHGRAKRPRPPLTAP